MSNLSDLIRHAEELGLDLPFGVRQYLPFRNEQAVTTVLGSNLVVRQDKADAALAGLLTDLIAEREAREDAEDERIEAVRRYRRAEELWEQEKEAREKAEAATGQLQWMLDYVLNAIADESGCVTLQEGDASTTYFSVDGCREHLSDLAARYEEEHDE